MKNIPHNTAFYRINYIKKSIRGDIIKRFYKSVLIVTIFSVVEKFLGFIYRIFLSRTIGSVGLGLYQITLSVFALLLTVCSSGIPITVSRFISKYRAENNQKRQNAVITAGITITLLLAVPIFLFSILFTEKLSFLFADKQCLALFKIIAPAFIFNSTYALLRGVFWGTKNFLPYSVTELLEETVMIIVGIILINKATDIYSGTKSAIIAVLISYVFSFVTASVIFIVKGGRIGNPKKELLPLVSSALPVTAMRTANSAVSSIVAVMLPLRLVAVGYSSNTALSLFGTAFGMSIPLLFIPTTIIGSFILVLVPYLAENFYKKNHQAVKSDIEKALKVATIIACFIMPVFFSVGTQIGAIVFSNEFSGKYLSYSSFLMLPMSLNAVSSSVLNSLGKEKSTLISYLISALLMLIALYLTPVFAGIYSLIIGYALLYTVTTAINLIKIKKLSPINIKKNLIVCFLCVIPTAILGVLLKGILLSYTGNLVTVIVVSVILTAFNFLLYVLTNQISVEKLKRVLSAFKIKKRQRV